MSAQVPQARQRTRKRGPQKRHWCFTSFDEKLNPFDPKVVRYCIFQREISESKRSHWQGYIEFFDPKRMGQVKTVLGGQPHVEVRQASRTEAREYCRKAASAVPNTVVEFGEWREDVNRKRKLSDMLKSGITLDDLIKEAPHEYVRYHRGLEKYYARLKKAKASIFRKLEVIVLIGPTGCGKTRRAVAYPDHFLMPCSDKLWLDGYDGETTFIIDDFYGGIKYGILLRILDGYELQLPVKGGFIWAQWTRVVITSNNDPCTWYKRGLTPALARRITKTVHIQAPNIAPINYVVPSAVFLNLSD